MDVNLISKLALASQASYSAGLDLAESIPVLQSRRAQLAESAVALRKSTADGVLSLTAIALPTGKPA